MNRAAFRQCADKLIFAKDLSAQIHGKDIYILCRFMARMRAIGYRDAAVSRKRTHIYRLRYGLTNKLLLTVRLTLHLFVYFGLDKNRLRYHYPAVKQLFLVPTFWNVKVIRIILIFGEPFIFVYFAADTPRPILISSPISSRISWLKPIYRRFPKGRRYQSSSMT